MFTFNGHEKLVISETSWLPGLHNVARGLEGLPGPSCFRAACFHPVRPATHINKFTTIRATGYAYEPASQAPPKPHTFSSLRSQ